MIFIQARNLGMEPSGFVKDFPTRPITMVVPAPAGGTLDAIARSLAGTIGKALGQIIIENKPGVSGMLAT